jgi:hypothetical protein
MCATHTSPTHYALEVVVRHARQIKQLETQGIDSCGLVYAK